MNAASIPHKRIVEDIRTRVLHGRSGERFVPIRMLMGEYGTSQRRIEAALELLVREGLLCHRPHQGYFITNRSRDKVRRMLLLTLDWPSQPLAAIEQHIRRIGREAGDIELTRRSYSCGSRPLHNIEAGAWDMIAIHPYALPLRHDEISDIADAPCPVAVIDKNMEEANISSVSNQDVLSGLIAAEYLLRFGHRRLLMLNAEPFFANARMRLSGFRQYAALHHAEVTILDSRTASGEDSGTKAYEALSAYLKERGNDFTAVFVTSDESGLGVYKALQMAGLRIPEDVSVIGHDNSQISQLLHPALSTVAIDYGGQAEALVDGLRAQYLDRGAIFQYRSTPELIERDSVDVPLENRHLTAMNM